ncbi:membrane protein [Streptomyces sp. AcH 505]|uniref:hypothetical protein n=1 Tax=unclassified Streptomyces TaxID=2593676 RepID=UPI000591DDFD|nr:hypothetical protein [Streptomyces sp. NBC_00370]KIF71455.1 membrane protein [Streptomyces sp. AcH 505]
MRASRALAVTATACAAVALSAPLAAANNGPSNVMVNPSAVHPGGTIQISADGCGHGGWVSSNAFPKAKLPSVESGHVSTTARIFNNATPGRYSLTVKCNDNPNTVSQQFTVLSGRGALGGLGGSVGPSSTEMAIGASLVATAAVGGSLFIARRRRMSGSAV